MNRYRRWLACAAALMAFGAAVGANAAEKRAPGDFEVTGPDGRRILLREDGRWRYIDPKSAAGDAEKKADGEAGDGGDKEVKAKEKPKEDVGEAVLTVERKLDGNRICRFGLKLVNNLKFEVRSLVPQFSAVRANGVVYDTVFSAFQFVRPGDSQVREIRFEGIACPDIARLQVTGGDRCEMGDLDKFSPVKGVCLSHVRVVESNLIRFDK
jgi:hypothetical protein